MKQRVPAIMALTGGLALWTVGVAQAAETSTEPAVLEEITVTGTNIRGAELVGNAVQIIGPEEVIASGKATLSDFLRELPANFAGGVATADNVQGAQDASSAGSNLTGGQGVNLRGLGALSTLVLVNGRRVASAGQFGDFVDLSNVPLAAIERIEVLLDGASAVYGSDAVGGVVNVILKRRDDGFNSSVRVGTMTQGGGTQTQVSQTWGSSWERGGVLLGYEFNDQQRVRSSDRDVYNGGDFSDRGGVNWRRASARAGTAANLFAGGAAGNGNVLYSVPGGAGTGLTVGNLIPATGGVGNTYDPWGNLDILPAMQRHSVFASFEHSLNDTVSLYGDARYTKREGDYNLGYAVLYGTLPSTNPNYIPGIANNFGVVLDDFGLSRDVAVDSYAANFGALIDLAGDWRAETNVSFSEEDQNRRGDALRNGNIYDFVASGNSLVNAPTSTDCALSGLNSSNVAALPGSGTAAQRYCAALNYTPFNPYSTDPISGPVLDQIIGYEDVDFKSWLAQASFKVDGSLFNLPGGAVRLATGVDYRKEHMSGELDFNWRSITDSHVPYGATEREVTSAFVEAAVPLVGADNAMAWMRELSLSLAARYERISGLGSYETTNPKFGVNFKPVDSLTLRGSWGTSFHAPPMRFMYTGMQPVGGGNAITTQPSFRTAPCNTTLVPLNGVVGTPGGTGQCSFTAMVVSGGAGPDLQPEEAETWTVGFDFAPSALPGLQLGASYFHLLVNDRIVRIQGGTLPSILAELFATGTTPYINSLSINPDVSEVQALMNDPRYLGQSGVGPLQTAEDVAMIIYATQSNLATLKMDGVDFNVSYAFPTSRAGTFDLFLRGTSLMSYDIKGTPAGRYESQLGSYSSLGNPVKLRTQQGLSWSYGALRSTLTVNYVDSYACKVGCYVASGANAAPVLATAPVKIDSWTTLDLNVSYDFDRFGGAFSGLRVGLSASNVTDEDPPFVNGGTAANDAIADPYDVANATVVGRVVALTFNKRW
jgi:outer membrane receptor protein involved in Fe transport